MDQVIEAVQIAENASKKKPEKLWNSMYVKILIVALLMSLSSNMLNTSLPLFIQNLGGNKAIAGTAMGVFTIAALVCRPLYGNLVDIKGRKVILLIGAVIYSVGCLGVVLTTSIVMILILRGIQGVGMSGISTSAGTVVADSLPSSRLSEGIGYYGISGNISTAIGPSIVLALIGTFGYGSAFITIFIISLVAILLTFTFNYEKKAKLALKAQEGYVEPEKEKINLKTAFEKAAIPGAIAQFMLIMPMGFAMTFIPTFGITAGIDNAGAYYTVYALTFLATRFFVGRLADRYGAAKVIIPGIIMVISAVLLLSFTKTITELVIAGGIIGFGYGCVNPTINAFIIKISPLSRRGAANATYYAAFDAGIGLGSMIGGVLVQAMGFSNTFLFLAGVTGMGLFIFLKYLRKQILQCELERKQIC